MKGGAASPTKSRPPLVRDSEYKPVNRARDESLMQAQLGAAVRQALRDTLAAPLPFEVAFLLDRLAAKERAAGRSASDAPRGCRL
jgi:hypothetical protein